MKEQKDPAETARLPELSAKRTGELTKTGPLKEQRGSFTRFEFYAFVTLLSLTFISGFVIPQPILDQYEVETLLIVGAVLGWGIRVFYKLTGMSLLESSDFFKQSK